MVIETKQPQMPEFFKNLLLNLNEDDRVKLIIWLDHCIEFEAEDAILDVFEVKEEKEPKPNA